MVIGYEERGLLGEDKEQGKREAARDMQAFNTDIRRKTNRATLGILPGTGNKFVDLILGTKPIWSSSNPQANAIKSLRKISNLDNKLLEAKFDLEDAKTKLTKIRLNKKIAVLEMSLEREETRFMVYNRQSKRTKH